MTDIVFMALLISLAADCYALFKPGPLWSIANSFFIAVLFAALLFDSDSRGGSSPYMYWLAIVATGSLTLFRAVSFARKLRRARRLKTMVRR
jgi:hypothetical protein